MADMAEWGDDEEPLNCKRCDVPFLWREGFVARFLGSGDYGSFYCSPECIALDEPKAYAEPLHSDTAEAVANPPASDDPEVPRG